jgi:hypothetical protein
MRTLKLIVEGSRQFEDHCTVELVESKDPNGPKKMPCIIGPMIETESTNRNGRVYPRQMMEACVQKYMAERMSPGKLRSYGELGHPEGVEINLHRWSHFITELAWQGNLVIGKAQLVDTEYGRIAETVLRNGLQLGVSSRGLGSLDESNGGKLVNEYELIAVDIVADPSAPKGFVEGIMESKEYIIAGGTYTEASMEKSVKAYENLKKSLATLPKKDVDSFVLGKIEDFLKNI